MCLEVVSEVSLPLKDATTFLVRTAEQLKLKALVVSLLVMTELFSAEEDLATILHQNKVTINNISLMMKYGLLDGSLAYDIIDLFVSHIQP